MHIRHSFHSPSLLLLAAAALLAILNWGMEARKWQLAIRHIAPLRFSVAYKAILSGAAFAVGTPNRMGEHAGRMLFLPGGRRLASLPATVQGSLSQLLITLYAGLAGGYLLRHRLYDSPYLSKESLLVGSWVVAAGSALLTLIYSNTAWASRRLHGLLPDKGHIWVGPLLHESAAAPVGRLLWLSLLRYGVFILQYLLLFRFFNVYADLWMLAAATSVLFLALAIVPTIAFAEVGLQGQLSLLIAGLLTTNSLGVILTATTAWMINLMLPALAGSIFMLGSRLIKQRSTKDERHFAVAGAGRMANEKTGIHQ